MAKKKLSNSLIKSGGNIPVVASLIVLVAFICGLLIGTLVVAKSLGNSKTSVIATMTGSFAQGYDAAKNKLINSGYFPHQNGTLSGQITGINGKEITFTASLVNPLDDESLKTRIAVITNDTVITLYRQKTADQIAQDMMNGQKEVADLQSQINSLQTQMSKCIKPSASGCASTSQEYGDALQKQAQASQQMNIYEKVANPSLSDLKAGMQITAYGEKVAQSANPATPLGFGGNFVDISESPKFNVSAIDVREVPMPIAPTVNPSTPAATTTPVK